MSSRKIKNFKFKRSNIIPLESEVAASINKLEGEKSRWELRFLFLLLLLEYSYLYRV
jgi:hypothetical protein